MYKRNIEPIARLIASGFKGRGIVMTNFGRLDYFSKEVSPTITSRLTEAANAFVIEN